MDDPLRRRIDGHVAQTTSPVKVSVIPPSTAGHASILGHEDDAGGEVVRLFWSLRTDAAGAPSFGPDCPSRETIRVEWRHSWTADFGESWGCSGACQDQSWKIDEDKTWRPCVGESFSESPAAPPFGVNNDRPEIAMHANGDRAWYMAINRTKDAETPTRVVVWMSLFGTPWQIAYESPEVDSSTGADVGDAWGQSMAIQQGVQLSFVPPLWQSPVLGLVWRTADKDGLIRMSVATSHVAFGLPGTWHPASLNEGQGVPWSMGDAMGLYTGTFALELCVSEPCPGGAPAVFPRIPFLAAWPDGRSAGGVSEVWARTFTP